MFRAAMSHSSPESSWTGISERYSECFCECFEDLSTTAPAGPFSRPSVTTEGLLSIQSILGLDPAQLDQLEARVQALIGTWQAPNGRTRSMTLRQAIETTLFALRHNLSQQALAWTAKVSQPTISRVIQRLRRVVLAALAPDEVGLADCQPAERLLLDGTLAPTGNRTGQAGEGLYSGKRHKAGVNLQVVCDGWGRLLHVSDPLPGATHDAAAFAQTGLDRLLAGHPTLC